MSHLYRNITGNTATDLIVDKEETVSYEYIRMCNVHASDTVDVDLYIYQKQYTDNRRFRGEELDIQVGDNGDWDALLYNEKIYYIIKNVTIPKGTSLVLNKDDFTFDNRFYKLYIKLSAGDSAVDVQLSTNKNIKKNRNIYGISTSKGKGNDTTFPRTYSK